jgi:hypothetical protein
MLAADIDIAQRIERPLRPTERHAGESVVFSDQLHIDGF